MNHRQTSLFYVSTVLVATISIGLWADAVQARSSNSIAGPDPREIPLPPIKTAMETLPGVNDLPVRTGMPDVMTMNSGQKVTTVKQWNLRREEMKKILEYYAIGQMPPPPGNVKGQEIKSELVLDGKVKYRLIHLTFGPERKLELNIGIFIPTDSKGPFPAIISQSGTPPGATLLPRLPQGPNQGKGQDVLLVVGPATTAGATVPVTHTTPAVPGQEPAASTTNAHGSRGGFGGPANAEDVAKRNSGTVSPRLCAGGVQSQ